MITKSCDCLILARGEFFTLRKTLFIHPCASLSAVNVTFPLIPVFAKDYLFHQLKKCNYKKQQICFTWFCERQDYRRAHEQYAYHRFLYHVTQIRNHHRHIRPPKDEMTDEMKKIGKALPYSALPVHPSRLIEKGYQVSRPSSAVF